MSLVLVFTSLSVSASDVNVDFNRDEDGTYAVDEENQKQESEKQETDTGDGSEEAPEADGTDRESDVVTEDNQKNEGVALKEPEKPLNESEDKAKDKTDGSAENRGIVNDSSQKDMNLKAIEDCAPGRHDLSSDETEVRFKNGQSEYIYTGTEIKPEIEVIVKPEVLEDSAAVLDESEKVIGAENYSVKYQDNIGVGEASIVIRGRDTENDVQDTKAETIEKDTCTGVKIVKFKITPADIKKCKLQTAKTVDYTGKQVKPKVTLSYQGKNLVSGKDYKAAYSNNKKMGTAVIRINGIGNFKGSRTVKFQIKFGTPVVKTTSSYSKINLKWKKVAAASGYVVYRSTSPKGKFKKIYTCKSGSKVSYSDKKANFEKTYYYKVRAYRNVKVKVKKKTKTKQEYGAWSAAVSENRKLGAVTIKSAKCSAETKAKVTWKKEAGAQGYEIYKSEAKEGKYVYAGKVKGAGKVSYTAKKLKPGVAYYFKVRAFRKSGSKTYYGGLSAVKKETFSDGQKLYTLFPGGVPTTKAEMEQYLVTITVPIKDAEGMPGTMQLRVHRALEKKFMKAFQEMYAVGFPVRAEDTDTYNWRSMASGRNRSHHSYGCVVDLNWNSNPMIGVTEGKYKPGIDPYSITPQVVAIWKKQGFYWGGNWKSTKDYMHFTYTNH